MVQHSASQKGVAQNKVRRSLSTAMWRGAKGQCPACGTGRMFDKYLKVSESCSQCGEELFHHEADDAPPYFTILILGHLLVPIIIMVERAFTPSLWVHGAIWLPVIIILSLVLLQITKGATVGLQWAYLMHGFGNEQRKNEKSSSLN
ncbi:MAG: DUF983 domain-containing protein [Methyloligellaceae bacterium]